jgi:hypothetical protein
MKWRIYIMNNTGYYIAKTLRMMNFLCKKYDVKRVIPDKDNPRFSVFLFEDSEELRDYLGEYK